MTRILAAATAIALAAAPLAANADVFRLDLGRFDLTTQSGTDRAWAYVAEVAHNNCGPVDMPQPLVLRSARASCQADVMRQAARAIEIVRESQLADLGSRRYALR